MTPRELNANALQAALDAEPKPITAERVIEIARATLTRPLAEQFEKWMGPNGARFVETLNG